MQAFGGGLLVVDTSAIRRSNHPDVEDEWADALAAKQIVICPPVQLELLFNARDHSSVEELAASLDGLRRLALTDTCARAAIAAMRRLARDGSAGYHRVPPMDYLVAACAQEAGADVLHYDRDYDRLAEVMAFESRWILPPGSVD